MNAPSRQSADRRTYPIIYDDALARAMGMVLIPALLGVLGWWLDSLLGIAPVLLIVLALFGVFCAFIGAYYNYKARFAALETRKHWKRTDS